MKTHTFAIRIKPLWEMEKAYDNLLLIYYSGTGNSKRVAEWIGHKAQTKGMKTYITSYHRFNSEVIAGFTGKTLIGFFSATHGFNMPHSMLEFIFRFKLLKGSDVFIGNTRAGMKLNKVFLPGLSGIALYFPALALWLKGYKIKGMYPVDLPSNWISLHPGIRKKVVESIVDRCATLTDRFAEKILTGQRVFLKSFVLLPLDILVAPISLGYYFIGRFVIAKTFIANSNCNNCGLCIQQCPTHSIVLVQNRPYWKFTCESCMKCMNYCPLRAIETAHSMVFLWMIALIYFINPFISSQVTTLVSSCFYKSSFAFEIIDFAARWVTIIGLFFGAYKTMHYFMRYPWFSKLVSYTSLTHFKFWRRYKIPKAHV